MTMNANPLFVSWEAAVQWLRKQSDQRELVLAAYYDDPLKEAADRYHRSEEWSAIRTHLDGLGGKSALDLGAGRGIASYALAKDGFEVAALEPDPSLLVGAGAIRQLAVETGLPINICEQYSENIPFPDAHFDVVVARAVLHHSRDLGTACKEVFRVLKPGGRFVAVREHVISKAADLPEFLAKHPLHKIYGGEHAYLLNAYISALRDAGFQMPMILSPFNSPINLFPQTEESLRREICSRIARFAPLAQMLERVLSVPVLYRGLLRLLTLMDQRPGRLYSFIADKR
jgi:SAM-dependent methyltransferase